MSNSKETAFARAGAVLHVGVPPKAFINAAAARTTVYFHDFRRRMENIGDRMQSQSFQCLGHEWKLGICVDRPATEVRDAAGNSYGIDIDIAIFLVHCTQNQHPIKIGWGTTIKNSRGLTDLGCINWAFSSVENSISYFSQTLRCAYSYCEGGALGIQVRMQSNEPLPLRRPTQLPFIPENHHACIFVQRLFMEEESADVVFEVGRGEQEQPNGTTETSVTTNDAERTKFFAHSLVLKSASPLLTELCKPNKSSTSSLSPSSTIIEIPGTSPSTFHKLLLYIYGFTIPYLGSDTTQTMAIIDAADKFGVSNLKLEAEAHYVNSLTITLDNAMEHFQYADSKNLALLKEAILDFIVKNKAEIVKKKLLSNSPVDLSNEILAAMMRRENVFQAGGGTDDDLDSMGISELRRKAFEKGLEVDGSREMLIAALESNKRQRTISGD